MILTMTKGNNGRAARRMLLQRLSVIVTCFVCIILLLNALGIGSSSSQKRKSLLSRTPQRLGRRGRGGGPRMIHVDLDDRESLDLILSASINLVAIDTVAGELKATGDSYSGVYGEFCSLNFGIHKSDPSSVPMFRDLVAHSPDCEDHRYRVDLQKVTELVRNHDAQPTHSQVQSLKLAGVVFHESRCGSTLVANALIGMNPSKHRVYSESAPPISALKLICGETYDTCSMEAAARILQDVIYLMSRSNDDKEERVFFKIQSVGTRNIPVFQHAFPQIPWIFVYRHPVEVLMSQLAQGPRYANCVRPRSSPPTVVKNIVTKSGFSSVKEISDEEYCAAHLASLTESAVAAMERDPEYGRGVNYADLPHILWTDVLPNHFGLTVTQDEIAAIQKISSMYSKGSGNRAKEWHEDARKKEEEASPEIRKAAELFLQSSYQLLKGETQHDDAL